MLDWNSSQGAVRDPATAWRRDAVIAAVIGATLGGSIALRLVVGEWPLTITVGAIAFVLHAIVIGLGQLVAATRHSVAGLGRIGASAILSVAGTAVIAWAIGS